MSEAKRILRLKCLTCEALTRMVYLCAAQSPHLVDVELLRVGLHNEPATLRERLQERIDQITSEDADAILLGYGLCGKATVGLTARHVPLVIPRAHDCITLFLGGRDRYKIEFEEKPGTYWYSQDYLERKRDADGAVTLGAGVNTDIQSVHDEYVEKYGQDNADYLMEVMGAWQSHYNRAVYVNLPVGESSHIETQAQEIAGRRGWNFERIQGDLKLVRKLIDGEWDQDFLIIQPDHSLQMSYDENVMMAVSAG